MDFELLFCHFFFQKKIILKIFRNKCENQESIKMKFYLWALLNPNNDNVTESTLFDIIVFFFFFGIMQFDVMVVWCF